MATIEGFAVFILSHGRPDRVYTYSSLRRFGYTGPIYIIIDNEDKTAQKYRDIYGKQVIEFDKSAIAETFDEGDNSGDHRAEVYARNASFEIARSLGITYFMELDDDYDDWHYKTDAHFRYRTESIRNLDAVFASMLSYYKSIPALSITMAQEGDFPGGGWNGIDRSLGRRRKCMNTWICSTERPFQFIGRMNEDVNTSTWRGRLGNVFMTFPLLSIEQKQTQANKGGMTDLYLDSGTYVKSFYTVMLIPSGVKVSPMGGPTAHRLHHLINWDVTVPCIIGEQYRKPDHA